MAAAGTGLVAATASAVQVLGSDARLGSGVVIVWRMFLVGIVLL